MPEMPGLPGMLGMPGWSSVPGMPDWSNWNPNGGDEDGRHPSLSHWPPTGAEGYPAYGHHPHGYRGWLSGRAYPHWRAGPGPRSWHARRWHLTWPSPPLAPPPSPSPFPPVFARITLRDATTLIQSPHLPPSPSSLLGVPLYTHCGPKPRGLRLSSRRPIPCSRRISVIARQTVVHGHLTQIGMILKIGSSDRPLPITRQGSGSSPPSLLEPSSCPTTISPPGPWPFCSDIT